MWRLFMLKDQGFGNKGHNLLSAIKKVTSIAKQKAHLALNWGDISRKKKSYPNQTLPQPKLAGIQEELSFYLLLLDLVVK